MSPALSTRSDGPAIPAACAPVRVVLAINHGFVLRSLRSVLDHDPQIDVVGEATDIAGVMRHVRSDRPRVLVIGASVPDGSILKAIHRLHILAPDTAIVLTTMTDDPRLAREAIGAGANACVLTDSADPALPRAIRRAAVGGNYLDPRIDGAQTAAARSPGPNGRPAATG
jgi:DNA-binding NarL/FixJ family response regulator